MLGLSVTTLIIIIIITIITIIISPDLVHDAVLGLEGQVLDGDDEVLEYRYLVE